MLPSTKIDPSPKGPTHLIAIQICNGTLSIKGIGKGSKPWFVRSWNLRSSFGVPLGVSKIRIKGTATSTPGWKRETFEHVL